MKGDFSRSTFNPAGHYTQLPLQQGRVLVDADWNEQAEIALYDQRITRRAVIGPSGGPLERAALRLQIVGGEPQLGIGGVSPEAFDPSSPFYAKPAWYWVEGRTLTQERAWPLKAQPHLTQALPTAAGYYLAWVDAFERLLTALDLPEIREVAMGGPDHGTRVQQIWQVRLRSFVFPGAEDPDCFDVPADFRPAPSTGRLHARAADPVTSQEPCVVPRTAGYRRLENQLYRVEIRDGGDAGTATFVWSRDNGVVRVRAIEGSYPAEVGASPSIQVAELGRDELTRLAAGDWVEITDDARTLAGLPGHFCQISSISSTTLGLSAGLSKADFENLKEPTVRRWDTVDESKHVGASYLASAAYPVSAAIFSDASRYFDLEDGVQVRFATGTFRTGDYWLIPARTTSGDVEFAATAQLPRGVHHHAAALGILHCNGAGVWRVVRDCRNLFPPLTRLTHLHYVGGDGQEAMPGGLLAAALEVAVTNGTTPVEGVDIVFGVTVPGGTANTQAEREARGYLLDAAATLPNSATGTFTRTVRTNAQGVAAVRWVLGTFDSHSNGGWSQHVTAQVDRHGPGDPTGELHFHATQSIARQVQVDIAACPVNEEDPVLTTVQQLMGLAGLDPSKPEHQNVQHVLHQLLCRLNARHVPYVFPTTPAEVVPATVTEVKSALDALYWLVLQREGCCCLSDVLKKLAELVGGKEGAALCEALQRGPVEGECSILEITLGSALNLVRVLYAIVLAFLDLQDAPGPGRGYQGLKLGNESGIELAAFIQGEGPGWFATRVEERSAQVRALGDRVLDLVLVTLERVLVQRQIDGPLRELAGAYGRSDPAWNGPATRAFVLERIWIPLFGTRRLDDVALIALRDLLLEIVRLLWREVVELLLCGEPVASRIPSPAWLSEIGDELGRVFERAFSLHGLVRELPAERWGTPMDVHMVAPSDFYPSGASWVVANARDASGRGRPFLLRWRHDDDGAGPLPALSDERLPENRVLPEPDLVITTKSQTPTGLTVLDSGARRRSLHVLVELAVAGALPRTLLWWLPSEEVSGLEGEVEAPFPPGPGAALGTVFGPENLPTGGTILVAGGPDDPPSIIGWTTRATGGMQLWPPTVIPKPFPIDGQALMALGVPDEPPSSLHAFSLDAKPLEPGRFVAVALTRTDSAAGQPRERNVLLLLEGRSGGTRKAPWWTAEVVVPVAAWDLPVGVRVVGGAHDLVALRDDRSGTPPTSGSSTGPRWTLVSVDELLGGAFPTTGLSWDNGLKSVAVEIPAARWREGEIDSVVHGNDGLWVEALGPLSGRLGLYTSWSGGSAPLQRQMVRGAAVGETSLSQAMVLVTGAAPPRGDSQAVGAEVRLEHDYLLQADGPSARLLTVCLRSANGAALIEFNASPRS